MQAHTQSAFSTYSKCHCRCFQQRRTSRRSYHLNYKNSRRNEQVQEVSKLKKTELDVFHENINRLTELVNTTSSKITAIGKHK